MAQQHEEYGVSLWLWLGTFTRSLVRTPVLGKAAVAGELGLVRHHLRQLVGPPQLISALDCAVSAPTNCVTALTPGTEEHLEDTVVAVDVWDGEVDAVHDVRVAARVVVRDVIEEDMLVEASAVTW